MTNAICGPGINEKILSKTKVRINQLISKNGFVNSFSGCNYNVFTPYCDMILLKQIVPHVNMFTNPLVWNGLP